MQKCSRCNGEFPEEEFFRCHDCGKYYCLRCAKKDPIIEALGICIDCEEVFIEEEDEWERE